MSSWWIDHFSNMLWISLYLLIFFLWNLLDHSHSSFPTTTVSIAYLFLFFGFVYIFNRHLIYWFSIIIDIAVLLFIFYLSFSPLFFCLLKINWVFFMIQFSFLVFHFRDCFRAEFLNLGILDLLDQKFLGVGRPCIVRCLTWPLHTR